ncbi:Na+/H+ antiporter [Methylorubrum extorquens]
MEIFEILLGLLAACVVLSLVARRLDIPLAVVLVLGGMALALIPGLPTVTLDPQLALVLFLPPLLQASAYRTDWPAFRFNLRPILFLALGAVLFTAATVAVTAKLLVPELPWAAAIALGAIVAPPDAVAAASVLKNFPIPKRLVVILEGESLLNDASSLVLYRFAVAATLAGEVSLGQASLSFLFSAVGGTLIGYGLGRVAMWVFTHLEDTLLDILVSFLAGFAAYLAAEQVHASGVLAAVTCGLVLGRQQHTAFSARTRLEMGAVWSFVEFVLTALIFVLIGLQLRGVGERLEQYDPWHLVVLGLAVSAALIVSRFVWVFPALWLPRALSRSLRERDPMPPWSHATVLSWAGMRGVVSLAAALALPANFPGRDLILFLAFCAILATLVIQGTTLGPLIRRLGLIKSEGQAANPLVTPQAIDARSKAAVAAMTAVTDKLDDLNPEQTAAAEDLLRELRQRAKRVTRASEASGLGVERLSARLDLRLTAIEAARTKLLADHRDELEHEEMAALMAELDLEEQQIRVAMGER